MKLRRTDYRRILAPLLLLCALLAAPILLTGCSPFGPNIVVDADMKKAIAEGAAREKKIAALTFPTSSSEDDKVRARAPFINDAIGYYGAVANKFRGTDVGLQALIAQGRLYDKGLNNKDMALTTYRTAVREYPGHGAEEIETELVGRMNEENKVKPGFIVLDTLVKLFGGNPNFSYLLAILAISLGVTLALWPLRVRYYSAMKDLQRYNPEMTRIRERYKDDKGLQQEKLMEFSQKHGYNQKMMLGCLPMLLQSPVLMGLWAAINQYQFQFASAVFLWVNPGTARAWQSLTFPPPFDFLNGAVAPSLGQQDLFLLVIYAVSMFVQMRMTPTTSPEQAEQQKMMSVMMPATLFIFMLQWRLPSAFVLYWLFSNIFTVTQQWWIQKNLPELPPLDFGNDNESGNGASAAISTKTGATVATATAGSGTASGGGGKTTMRANPRLVSPKSRRRK